MIETDWERGRWYRVYGKDGNVWCETSNKGEAERAAEDPESNGVVWEQWRREQISWRIA